MSTLPQRWANIAMALVLVPFWTSILVRTTAWFILLQREGPVNALLQSLRIVDAPLTHDLHPLRRVRRDGARAAAVRDPAAVQRDEGHRPRLPARGRVARRARAGSASCACTCR